ncbi:OmpA family protein [Pseudothioclava arenosa]|uniref:OmpA-like domain-containing protein n=1 Tax=Pseudothioclava arenosa TaxID=1795308 RepID=A0A2A4CPM4_9RHOB|nr:OmpA family protein [Pseudothioclava arenosa]PCD76066.1 hypothetical protein CLN94_11300 [Pseudothioclava arenosa]
MALRPKIMTPAAFGVAAVLSFAAASGIAALVEDQSGKAVKLALEADGHGWAQVQTDGLQVILAGTAPDEAERFRAVSKAGTAVDKDRIIDVIDVETRTILAAPEFSLEILRNGEGIQLIGLLPKGSKRGKMIEGLREVAKDRPVTDMLETVDYPAPVDWQPAVDFALEALATLPRSKISVQAGKVDIVAITDSREEKARIETTLARRRPSDLVLSFDISAPRPVITPFTLRFLIDTEGARFDACSADTEEARNQILAAAREAGAEGALGCTIGMGTPSPDWARAVSMTLRGLKELGAGSATFSDADIALSAAPSVSPRDFDRVVGELESNLPEVFSLKAELERPETKAADTIEFLADKGDDGQLTLRGRVLDDAQRTLIENYARALFGHDSVYGAMRSTKGLPEGWSVRAMAGLEALAELHEGQLLVTPDLMRVTGVSGNANASDEVARVLAGHLGEGARIDLKVQYDKRLDPVLSLPDGPECVRRLNAAVEHAKITFEPGSSTIAAEGAGAMDGLAAAMKDCEEFRIEVGGHTDSQGRDEMNLSLSQDRAQAVVRALMDRRISVRNMTAKGFGETQPIADNDTEEGREANRRIEFVLLDTEPMEQGEAAVAEVPTPIPDAVDAEPSEEELNAEFTETDAAPMEHEGEEPAEEPAPEDMATEDAQAESDAPTAEAPDASADPAPTEPEAAPAPATETTTTDPAATDQPEADPPAIEVQTPDKTTPRPLPRPQGLGDGQ